jgi:hypothetical protein
LLVFGFRAARRCFRWRCRSFQHKEGRVVTSDVDYTRFVRRVDQVEQKSEVKAVGSQQRSEQQRRARWRAHWRAQRACVK